MEPGHYRQYWASDCANTKVTLLLSADILMILCAHLAGTHPLSECTLLEFDALFGLIFVAKACTRRTGAASLLFVEILNSLHTGDVCTEHIRIRDRLVKVAAVISGDVILRDDCLRIHHQFIAFFD